MLRSPVPMQGNFVLQLMGNVWDGLAIFAGAVWPLLVLLVIALVVIVAARARNIG